MNKKRRQELSEVTTKLASLYDALSRIASAESDALSNYPENLEGSSQYEESENIAELLDDAVETLKDALDILNGI